MAKRPSHPFPAPPPPELTGEAARVRLAGVELRRFAGTERHSHQLAAPIRVAHLTDQHVGLVTPMRVQRAAVDLTNAQRPDIVALTGDFVAHSLAYLDALGELIAAFDAPVFAVLGNHDHWAGAPEVRQALRRAGAEVLDNAHTIITLRGERLQVVGLDDAYTGHADHVRAVRGLRRDLPALGLSHIAEEADALWEHGVPLVLSGHTHAGQLTFARLHELTLGRMIGHRYVHGLYGTRREGPPPAGAVYVGAGIGASVMPLRVGDRGRREVTVFDLGVAPGTLAEHHAEQRSHPGKPPSPELKAKRAAQLARKQKNRERHR